MDILNIESTLAKHTGMHASTMRLTRTRIVTVCALRNTGLGRPLNSPQILCNFKVLLVHRHSHIINNTSQTHATVATSALWFIHFPGWFSKLFLFIVLLFALWFYLWYKYIIQFNLNHEGLIYALLFTPLAVVMKLLLIEGLVLSDKDWNHWEQGRIHQLAPQVRQLPLVQDETQSHF